MSKRLLVTGSRDFVDKDAVAKALSDVMAAWDWPTDAVLVHGAARGADALAKGIWTAWGLSDDPFPADWKHYGLSAGPKRNAVMVASGADLCLAFPLPQSKGTYDCMRKAKNAGIEIVVIVASRMEHFT